MTSPTVRPLTADDIARVVQLSFGGEITVTGCGPLAGGGYAAVWSVALSDGRTLVLKVAPPAGVTLLRYEASLIEAEADYFRLVRDEVPGVPVPDVVHLEVDPVLGSWLFTTLLPGKGLPDLAASVDSAPVRRQLGEALALVHRVTGNVYGYSGDRPHGADWPSAFRAIIEALLGDAQDWQVDLGDRPDRVRRALSTADLAEVVRPALLHFDLWDGNVLAVVDGASARLSGLVDGERWLYGDPLVDFVSPALFRRIEDEPDHPFVAGYRSVTGVDPLTPSGVSRLRLYRLWLALLMVVEQPSRGAPVRSDRGDRLWTLLDRCLDDVGA